MSGKVIPGATMVANKQQIDEYGWRLVEERFGGEHSCRLSCVESGIGLEVLVSLGGAVNGLRLAGAAGVTEVIAGYGSAAQARVETPTSFRGSPLFPWPNRLAGGAYVHLGRRYQLAQNFSHENNAIHGLIYDQPCVVTSLTRDEDAAVLQLRWCSEGQLPGYPFTCELTQEYRLDRSQGFSCEATVINQDTLTMPVGYGWHPYVQLGGGPVDRLYLHLPPGKVLAVDQRMIPTGSLAASQLFADKQLLGNTQLDHCLQLEGHGSRLETILTDRQTGQALHLWQETGGNGYRYLQVYTPPDRRSLAIEPMTCAPDAFNNGLGLLLLSPGERISWRWGIHLKRL